jgi:glycosyltransferase involved in cell wall biosynthesis
MNVALEHADLVTCTTKTLAKEYKKIAKNVVILPNYIDPMDWPEPLRNEGDKTRIGIVGSAAIEYDYLHVKDVLRQLSKRKDVELVMFGLGDKEHRKANPIVTKVFQEEYAFWDSLNIEHFPWCKMYDYQEKLNEAKLDLMIIPRKDNYFNRCKSNIKFLEASMLEIPVIAQSFDDGPYEEIDDMRTGWKIRDNADWMKVIEWNIKDRALRRHIGKTAKEYVLKNYNIADHAHKWREAYEQLYA